MSYPTQRSQPVGVKSTLRRPYNDDLTNAFVPFNSFEYNFLTTIEIIF